MSDLRHDRETEKTPPRAGDTPSRLEKPAPASVPDAERTAPAPAPAPTAPAPKAAVPAAPAATPAAVPVGNGADELERLSRRLERAVGGFVDDPRRAVREADAVMDEAAARLTRLLEERRTALRGTWHGDNGERTGTEELRVALTKYRDMTRQLLTSL